MRKTSFVLPMGIVVAAAFSACFHGSEHCLDFEDTTAGTQVDVGGQFTTTGTSIAIEPFQWANGIWTSNGSVRIDNRNYALGSGNDVNTRNATLSPAFPYPVEWIWFRFGELGGNNNIRINSTFANVPDLAELNGTTLGGAQILVTATQTGNNWFGAMLILGPVDDFAIGGQELWLDNLCYFTTSTGPAPTTWARSYGGPGRDGAWSILATMDGSYLVAGESRSFDSTSRLWLLKLDPQGAILWERMYEQATHLDEYARVRETSDGGFVISHQGSGTHVLRLTPSGDVMWSRAYDLGGSYAKARSLALAADGSIFLAGTTSHPGAFWADAWVMRLDASGNVSWSKRYGTANGLELFNGIEATGDGGCVATGPGPTGNVWVVKLDANGNSQWQREYATGIGPHALSILQTTDGGYLATGLYEQGSNYHAWLLRLDASGNPVWQRRYGDSLYEIATAAFETSTGGFVVTGAVYEPSQSIDFWVFETNAGGDVLWQRRYGGTEPEFSRAVTPTQDGGMALAGRTHSFGAGQQEVWVVKLAADGSCAEPCPWTASTSRPATDMITAPTTTSVAPVDVSPTVTPRTVTPINSQATVEQQCPTPPGGG